MQQLKLSHVHPSWRPIIQDALQQMDPHYIELIQKDPNWLPGHEKIFNAFSIDLKQTNYILFGESPYPRAQSANGYAFWDGAVNNIWSEKGLSKQVNRATSLRNFIKMLLVAHNYLEPEQTSQEQISNLDKSGFVQTLPELFHNLLNQGILLLNASLVLSSQSVRKDAKAWQPFVNHIIGELAKIRPDCCLILLGNIAKEIDKLPATKNMLHFCAEHPYNVSFINNPAVIDFFKKFNLLAETANTEHGLLVENIGN